MEEQHRVLSTREVKELYKTKGIKVLDIRPADAYNGWRMRDEVRGGHIPGAKSTPFKWSKYIDWIEIIRSKGIRTDDKVIVYGYSEGQEEDMAELLRKTGHRDVSIYKGFLEEWCTDERLPMEKLTRFRQLVHPDWLRAAMRGEDVEGMEGKDLVVCHAHYRNSGDYEKGHIPGAVALDTLQLESPETWNRRGPEEIRDTLLGLGIDKDTTVVLYGRFAFPRNEDPFPGSSAGHLGAIRCAFIMLFAGVKDVKILNGGIQSWEDEGYSLTTARTEPKGKQSFGTTIPVHPELAVDTPEAKEMIRGKESELVCVRSWPEYIGEVSGYNYIEKKGRIPGAVWSDCGSDAYHMENFRNLDHTIREAQEVEAEWKASGIVPGKHLALYCGTGWRGSEAFFNAWLMGWPRVAVYDGGWFEWSNDPENTVESGIPGE